MLSYMQQKKPVLAATDSVTDIGKIIIRNLFGYWVMQGDKQAFLEKMDSMFESKNMLSDLGINGYNYLLENYTVSSSYNKIIKHV
jgi:hypothetical protein